MNKIKRNAVSRSLSLLMWRLAIGFTWMISPLPIMGQHSGLDLRTASLPDFQAGAFTIPVSHPRLWWNAERLAQARTYYATHPFTPASHDYYGNALRYVLTGEATYARTAIDWMMSFTLNANDQSASNYARWLGETVMLVYDWCNDQMTPTERQTIIDRWNGYIEIFNNKQWGGIGMESNNFYQGFMRNSIEWGLVSYHENPLAQHFLDHGLITRWRDSFIPWTNTKGRGGVAEEGVQYGRYMLDYQVIPLTSVELMGREILSETNFYKEALFYLIYATSTAPLYTSNPADGSYYQMYPFGDNEMNAYPPASNDYYGNFATMATNKWKNVAVGQYGRQWLNQVASSRSYHVNAVDTAGTAHSFTDLPLDYYAPGFHNFYVKNNWSATATSALLQLGFPGSHGHLDWGTFQIQRGNRWLTRETTGYGTILAGFGGSGLSNGTGTLHHNGIVFTGRGWTIGCAGGYNDGYPEVIRLESKPQYAYAAVDLSLAYQARSSDYTNDDGSPRDDNPFAKNVVREFVFIRPLEALVILDRLEAESDSKWGPLLPASQVVKTFVLHSVNQPVIEDGHHVLLQNGNQALHLTTLLPTSSSYVVVDNGNYPGSPAPNYPEWYQYRIEVNDSGQAQSYFLSVLQARDASAANLTATVTDSGTEFQVNLTHPSLGNATIKFQKGMRSTGGQFGYAASGTPTLTALTNSIQNISVTDAGPIWSGAPAAATLISPSGRISTSSPTYSWNAVPTATWYQLWVNDASASPKIQQWYTAAQASCASGAGTCSVTPTTALATGRAQWWIQTWNDWGYGPWSDAMSFIVSGAPPGAATLIAPAGAIVTRNPTYTWNAVATATWYQLWVNDASASPKIQQWYTAAQAACGTGAGTCSVTPSVMLATGAAQWWIQTWNDFGYGPWSNAMSFTIPSSAPGAAALISPLGAIDTRNPTHSWNAAAGATWYLLCRNDAGGDARSNSGTARRRPAVVWARAPALRLRR